MSAMITTSRGRDRRRVRSDLGFMSVSMVLRLFGKELIGSGHLTCRCEHGVVGVSWFWTPFGKIDRDGIIPYPESFFLSRKDAEID